MTFTFALILFAVAAGVLALTLFAVLVADEFERDMQGLEREWEASSLDGRHEETTV